MLMFKSLRKKSTKPVAQVLMKAVNMSQLLDKKIIAYIKTPQHLDSFRLSTTKVTFKDNLPFKVKQNEFDKSEQCQQNTRFIRNLLDDTINKQCFKQNMLEKLLMRLNFQCFTHMRFQQMFNNLRQVIH